jgi:hypothetical protein
MELLFLLQRGHRAHSDIDNFFLGVSDMIGWFLGPGLLFTIGFILFYLWKKNRDDKDKKKTKRKSGKSIKRTITERITIND